MGLEKHLEKRIVDYVGSLRGVAYKLRIDGENGFPDRSIFLPGGKLLLLETKTPIGRLSANQIDKIDRLTDLGFVVRTCDNWADAKRIIDTIVGLEW